MERLEEKQIEVEQLKREIAFKRQPVSQCLDEFLKYILDNQKDDFLANYDKNIENPFIPKGKFCKL